MEVIIVSITPYKEKDGIANAISKEGTLSFTIKGIYDGKSKFSSLNAGLTIVDVELTSGNEKFHILKSYKIIQQIMTANNSLPYLSAVMIINEAVKSTLSDDDKPLIYDWLYNAIVALKNDTNPLLVLLVFFANILRVSGYELEVNKCVYCGTRENIVAFSFTEGGFLCKNCTSPDIQRDLTGNQMLLVRAAFKTPSYAIPEKLYNDDDCYVLLKHFFAFIDDAIGVSLKNVALLDTIKN